MLVLLVSGGLLRAARGPLTRHLKHAVIWLAAFAVLAFGYAYRAELADAPRRLGMAFNIGAPVQIDEHTLVVPQSEDGAYVVDGLVNGQRVRFMVDTGSTETVLAPDDARRLGVAVDKLDYAYKAETANGVGYGAVFAAKSLEVGPIRLRDVPLMVNKAPMSASLLGMNFLKRLDAFEFRGRTLVLKWREDGQGRAI
jgi:aspartyl protease family protein